MVKAKIKKNSHVQLSESESIQRIFVYHKKSTVCGRDSLKNCKNAFYAPLLPKWEQKILCWLIK